MAKKSKATAKKTPAKKVSSHKQQQIKNTVTALILFGVALCVTVCFIGADSAPLTKAVNAFLLGCLGFTAYLIPVLMVYVGILLVAQNKKLVSRGLFGGGFLLMLSAFTQVCAYDPALIGKSAWETVSNIYSVAKVSPFSSGGAFSFVAVYLSSLTGAVIMGIIIFVVMLVVFAFATGITFETFIGTPEERAAEREKRLAEEEKTRIRKEEEAAKAAAKEKPKKAIFPVVTAEDEKPPHTAAPTPAVPFTTNLDGKDKPTEAELITKEEIIKAKQEVAAEIEAREELEEKEEKEYIFPDIKLLTMPEKSRDLSAQEDLRKTGEKLVAALKSFNVEASIVHASRGPTVTRYELAPELGVKIKSITSLSDDIALNLAAKGVRIEAPIPGKAAIGIEVPNAVQQIVRLREIIDTEKFRRSDNRLTVALGKDISGEGVMIELDKMPHLLIAGATGTGKSVCINSILMSILYKATPEEVKLILVDPKMVEFTVYKGIPHLLIPVVNDPKKAAGALSWAVSEMLSRYQAFSAKSVRDLNSYNRNLAEGEKKLPQIVIVIDELADLMIASPKEVEDAVTRLAQMARAAGMYLVIATQRPSADVITGIIKANIPSRIALAVSSGINSRIIIDDLGAEKLIGKGDMLYDPLGAVKPMRIQGCFVSDKEVESVVASIKENFEGEYDKDIIEKIDKAVAMQQQKGKQMLNPDSDDDDGADDMFMRAVEVVVDGGKASTSFLQRKIGVGYSRGAKLIDLMEERGIVGPYQGSKPREVLISRAQFEEMKMNGGTPPSDNGEA